MSRTWILAITVAFTSAWVVSSSAEVVWLKQAGDRQDYSKYATLQYASIKVSFGVWPVAWGHTAGTVWTDDGWQTVNWQTANWESNVANPFGGQDEAWGVRLFGNGNNGRYVGQPFEPFAYEYALYVTDRNGNWNWDNNRGLNHRYPIN